MELHSAVSSILKSSPITVVDVGAAGGIQPIWKTGWFARYARYAGFEPNPENFAKLRCDETTAYHQLAISDRSGRLPFHAHKTVGSLVERKDRAAMFGEEFETIEVEVDTLANLRERGTIPRLDVIKTDVERHDYFAVKGAGEYLRRETLAVTSEFEYHGQEQGSRFRDIDDLVTSNGFLLFGLQHKLGTFHEIFGGDVLYLKDAGHVIRAGLGEAETVEQLIKLYLISLLLGKHPYAYCVARMGQEEGIWSNERTDELLEPLSKYAFLPDAVPLRKGGLRLANGFSLLAQIFSGGKWGGKAAPRPASLTPLTQLTVPAGYLPRSWRRRAQSSLEERYRRYRKLLGISTHYN